jgi:hypothetical protein
MDYMTLATVCFSGYNLYRLRKDMTEMSRNLKELTEFFCRYKGR